MEVTWIIDGGDVYNVLDFYITSPVGGEGQVYRKKDKGKYTFISANGVYSFCLSKDGDWKVVEFSLFPVIKKIEAAKFGGKTDNVPTMMEGLLEQISMSLDGVNQYQVSFKSYAARGFYSAVTLNKSVKKWSLLQGVMVIVTGLGQVFIVRKLFADNKGPNKQ